MPETPLPSTWPRRITVTVSRSFSLSVSFEIKLPVALLPPVPFAVPPISKAVPVSLNPTGGKLTLTPRVEGTFTRASAAEFIARSVMEPLFKSIREPSCIPSLSTSPVTNRYLKARLVEELSDAE